MTPMTLSTSTDYRTHEQHHVINGALVRSTGEESIAVVNPATEEVIGSAPDGTAADVDAAVQAATAALGAAEWAGLGVAERAATMRRLSQLFLDHTDEVVGAVVDEAGTVAEEAYRTNVDGPYRLYKFYADVAERTQWEETRANAYGHHTIVRKEPVGVCGMITAWNAPQAIVAMKLGPALAAGCTAVIKPAPETPFDSYVFMRLVEEAGIPPGVVNVVFGGAETGQALVTHPLVRKISFTGSPAAGRAIASAAGQLLKPVTLELGGKSAAILLEDVDVEHFTSMIASHCLANNGQICALSTRVLAPRSRYEEIVDAMADTFRSWRVGDPRDPETNLGPLVADRQRARVEGYIASGRDQGAKVVVGGGRPGHLDRGYYVEPTLFRDVDNSMRIAREEIFGPVIGVIPYTDVDDAIRLANDSDYGLGGTVFTSDDERGTEVARRVETGSIGVNLFGQFEDAPFGGVKDSGYGRELGAEAVDHYLRLKSIYRTGTPA
jgi:aldehyde dehydrogenase (NAD+)